MQNSKLITWLIIWTSILTWCSWWQDTFNNIKPKDWSYNVKQNYKAWEYNPYIEVTADLKDGKIDNVKVVWDPSSKGALRYADEFEKTLKSKIIGQTIEDWNKNAYLAWASLTSTAFTNAMTNIKKQAMK